MKTSVINILLLLLNILTTGGVLHQLYGEILSPFFFLLLAIAFLLNYEPIHKTNVYIFVTIALGSFSVLLLNYLLVPFDNCVWFYVKFILRWFSVVLLLLYYKQTKYNLTNDLILTLKIVAIHSLIGFVSYFFLNPFLYYIQHSTIESNTFFNIFYYTTPMEFLGIKMFRNQGLFWEPGILQMYLNILIFYYIFVKKKIRESYFYAILVLTTISTTGIGIVILLYTMYFFPFFLKYGKKQIIIGGGILCIIVGVILIPNLLTKLHSVSYGIRLRDIWCALLITSQHPLCGIGLDMDVYNKIQNTLFITDLGSFHIYDIDYILDRGNTNSFLMIFVQLGIPLALIYISMFYCQCIFTQKFKFFLMMLICIMSEPLFLGNFFMLFVVTGAYYILYPVFNNSSINYEKKNQCNNSLL